MTLLNLFNTLGIDVTRCYISADAGSNLSYDFDINPIDFLNYSKEDLRLNNEKGNINALSNAKRAIDCQTDRILGAIGIRHDTLPEVIHKFISRSETSIKKDIPTKLRFLESMNFAPVGIIASTRTLRNKLEHYYKKPSRGEVTQAIELAQLFMVATDSKLNHVFSFYISDTEKRSKAKEGSLLNTIYFDYDFEKNIFEVSLMTLEKNRVKLTINNSTLEFYYLLKLATSFDYEDDVRKTLIDLIDIIGHQTPRNNINVTVH